MKSFFCANCEATVELNRHGYCERCGSDALDVAVRPCVTAESLATTYLSSIEELERIYEKS